MSGLPHSSKPPKLAIVKVVLIVKDVFNAKPVFIDNLSQKGRKVRPLESNMERWGEYVISELRVNFFLKRPTKKSFLMRMF